MLYLKKKLYLFNKTTSPLCSFWKIRIDTVPHFFSECPRVKQLFFKLKTLFITDFSLPEQTANFGFQNKIPNTYFVHSLY